MKKSFVFRENYQSPLGLFQLVLKSTDNSLRAEPKNNLFITAGHEILVKKLIPSLDWMPGLLAVESVTAWVFYIGKYNSSVEQLNVSIELVTDSTAVQCGATTGQNLIAIEFEDGIRQLHIGTEDEEAMAARAAVSNWMPSRLESSLWKYELEITSITPRGLATQVPSLSVGEHFYFHYIVAENPCRPAADYPDELDSSTWFAVEQTKKQLEQNWRPKA